MVDPLISLAVAVTSRRGVFALLLGSGLSRAAGVPTGWEVVLDLVRKVALLEGADPGTDPAGWWHGRTGKDPSYSDLLEALGRSPAERANLLQGYFEPDEDERSRGLKTPTKAHHAIARLVRDGYIRVIVTTNFDRLLEQALESEGVVPAVISSPAAAKGAQPLAHTACTIIKVHGDYVSTDLKNTPAELATYDPAIDRLLDQILDEYGLIVCGWSADWDTALRAAIERAPNRRYSTYWAARGALTETAMALVRHRQAEVLEITDADTFFADLEAKVQALAAIGVQHPLSAPAAAAELKRYLPDPQARIALHDLVTREAKRLAAELTPERFPTTAPPPTPEEVERRLVRYEETSAVCLALLTTGCYFGGPEHHRAWVQLLERLLNRPGRATNGEVTWLALVDYPILLLLYAGGTASVLGGHDDTLYALLRAERREPPQQPRSLIQFLSRRELYNQEDADPEVKRMPGLGNDQLKVPMSEWLHRRLRPWMEELTADEATYDHAFDWFEYLSALLQDHSGGRGWISGRWMYLIRDPAPANPAARVAGELEAAGEEWPLLQLGAFDGNLETLHAISKRSINGQRAGRRRAPDSRCDAHHRDRSGRRTPRHRRLRNHLVRRRRTRAYPQRSLRRQPLACADPVRRQGRHRLPIRLAAALRRRGVRPYPRHGLAGRNQPGITYRRSLRYRLTNEVVRHRFNVVPLSVSTDRIGVTAMRCASLLDTLDAAGQPVDRAGGGRVVEVYPAAALKHWGLAHHGYKNKTDVTARDHALHQLLDMLPSLILDSDALTRCRHSHDAFDALVCALVARAAALSRTTLPRPGNQTERARVEGWCPVSSDLVRVQLADQGEPDREAATRLIQSGLS